MNRLLKGPLVGIAAVAALTIGTARVARADQIVYWTNYGSQELMKTDVTTSTTTVLESTPASAGYPDSLIFDTAGNIIYSDDTGTAGQVRSFNPNTTSDALIKGGLSSETVDLALDPGGTTVLVSDSSNNAVKRVTLAGGATKTLASIATPSGIAYDTANGHLFVVTFDGAKSAIVQINPTTGLVINTSAYTSGIMDGLTYDPGSNLLYAAFGGCIQTFDPGTLVLGPCVGGGIFKFIDGLESDGAGHILVADYGAQKVGNYNIGTGVSSYLFSAPTLDDIAPVAGLGAPPQVPEPGSFALFSTGLLAMVFLTFLKSRVSPLI
jgi:DNA-binding beta-propeller fold protein YncE